MTSVPKIINDTATLIIAWRPTNRTHARMVQMDQKIAAALHGAAAQTLEAMTSGHPYSPDIDIEDNTHLVASRTELLDVDLLAELERGASQNTASEEQLRKTLLCYGVVVATNVGDAIFVRKANPIMSGEKKIRATLVGNLLGALEQPLFSFDGRFDVIITADLVYVLDKGRFELLFKDSEAVLAAVPEWVDELAETLPMTGDSKDHITTVLRRNSRLRTKFHSVTRQPFIAELSPEHLREKMQARGLDPDALMDGDELRFDAESTDVILKLLNEDLFQGMFSGREYSAGSKRPRGG
ncbi:hypothetical protein [Mycobacteroides abscessus]